MNNWHNHLKKCLRKIPQTLEEINDTQLFKDLGRDISCTFCVDGVPLKEIGGSSKGVEGAYKEFEDAIKSLSEDQKKKVLEFCKDFPAQGVVFLFHPRMSGTDRQQGAISTGKIHFAVNISGENIHVITNTGREVPQVLNYVGNGIIVAKVTTPVCKFEFDYHPEDGSSSNVKVMEYSGQRVAIDVKASV